MPATITPIKPLQHFVPQSITTCSREDGRPAVFINPDSKNVFCVECGERLAFLAFRTGMACPLVAL